MRVGRNSLSNSSKVKQDKIDQGSAGKGKDNIITNRAEDNVQLSPEAQNLQRIHTMLDDIPDVRLNKVNEIKEKLDKGEYTIDCNKVATKMIRETLLDHFLKGK